MGGMLSLTPSMMIINTACFNNRRLTVWIATCRYSHPSIHFDLFIDFPESSTCEESDTTILLNSSCASLSSEEGAYSKLNICLIFKEWMEPILRQLCLMFLSVSILFNWLPWDSVMEWFYYSAFRPYCSCATPRCLCDNCPTYNHHCIA